jgi:hypothetical protein
MNLTDFVGNACVEQNPLGGCGLARINVRTNTNVSVSLDRSLACHCMNLG